jgi:hypothetical protein
MTNAPLAAVALFAAGLLQSGQSHAEAITDRGAVLDEAEPQALDLLREPAWSKVSGASV